MIARALTDQKCGLVAFPVLLGFFTKKSWAKRDDHAVALLCGAGLFLAGTALLEPAQYALTIVRQLSGAGHPVLRFHHSGVNREVVRWRSRPVLSRRSAASPAGTGLSRRMRNG